MTDALAKDWDALEQANAQLNVFTDFDRDARFGKGGLSELMAGFKANIAGLPALSMPAGWSADGLPIAVQIVGPAGAEEGLFAHAQMFDAELSAYRAPKLQGEPD